MENTLKREGLMKEMQDRCGGEIRLVMVEHKKTGGKQNKRHHGHLGIHTYWCFKRLLALLSCCYFTLNLGESCCPSKEIVHNTS